MEKLREKAVVMRLTIDEKLSDDLIRLLVCPLVTGKEEFQDETGDWEAESELLVGPANYAEIMGIPDDLAKEYPWKTLGEGNVFLSGWFGVIGDEKSPAGFMAVSGRRNFLCIDGLVRKRIKKLYFDALEGRKTPCRKT